MGLKTNKAKQTATQSKESPVKVVPVMDDDGAGPATPAATSGSKARKEKDPPNVRIVGAIKKTLERLSKLDRAFGHWDSRESSDETPNLGKMFSSAQDWLNAAKSYADGLGEDFKAPRKPRSGTSGPRVVLTVEKGDIVSIKPAAIMKYLEDDETDLPGGNRVTVVAFSKDGKSAKCKFGDNMTYFVLRSHLCQLIK